MSRPTTPMAAPSDTARCEIFCLDMNGILRGKSLPFGLVEKARAGTTRLPLSTQTLDIWGNENDELTQLSASIGDPDGLMVPDAVNPQPVPWRRDGSLQMLTSLHEIGADGTRGSASPYDGRAILAAEIARFTALGLTPVVAMELEFYLLDSARLDAGEVAVPAALRIGEHPRGSQLYDMATMDAVQPFLDDVVAFAAHQNLPAETAIAEFGVGQFEVNLSHRPDALAAADDAALLKRLVQAVASRHQAHATFAAKPYSDDLGSGLHIHISLLDADGRNVLGADGPTPERMHHAVGGLLATACEAQAIFAPHANSYRRLQPGLHAPIGLNWGYEHRGAAVRIPEERGTGARVEHRMAGADAHPHLALAMVLAGIRHGLETKADPGQPLGREPAGTQQGQVSPHWHEALDRLEASSLARTVLGDPFHKTFLIQKGFEATTYARTVTEFDRLTYLPRL